MIYNWSFAVGTETFAFVKVIESVLLMYSCTSEIDFRSFGKFRIRSREILCMKQTTLKTNKYSNRNSERLQYCYFKSITGPTSTSKCFIIYLYCNKDADNTICLRK